MVVSGGGSPGVKRGRLPDSIIRTDTARRRLIGPAHAVGPWEPGLFGRGVLLHPPAVTSTGTLASRLGTTEHLSPLLRRVSRLGLGPRELEALSVQRGCRHYAGGNPAPAPTVPRSVLSDLELAIALLSPGLPYDPHTLRCGAAMLGAAGNDPRRVARWAAMERCVPVVRHVAEAGRRYEPTNPFWPELLAALPPSRPPKAGVLPHPSRFVAMTGFTRNGAEFVAEWQRPATGGSIPAPS